MTPRSTHPGHRTFHVRVGRLIIASTFVLAFGAACATTAPPSDLEYVSTVAVAGMDGSDLDAASLGLNPEESTEVAAASEFDPDAFEVVQTEDHDRVLVAAPGADRVVVGITSVTIGEALAFLSGGHMPGTSPNSMEVGDGDIIDLSDLVERGTSIVTLDVQALDANNNVVGVLRKLVQISPLELEVERQGNFVQILLTTTDDSPIPDAVVELLDADSRVIDQQTTDNRGAVTLSATLPRSLAVLGEGLFVAARVGKFRALLRL